MKHRPVHPWLASTLPQRQPRPGPVPDPTSKPGSEVAIDHDFHCTCLISQSNSFPLHFAGITVRLRSMKDSCISHYIDRTRTTRTQRNLLGDIRSPPRFPRTGPAPFLHDAGQWLRSVQSSGVRPGSGSVQAAKPSHHASPRALQLAVLTRFFRSSASTTSY